jgi:hydrogenase maturation protease
MILDLILGLGNPLMGDDGVGCVLADMLASDPRLPETAQAIAAGSDVLSWMSVMEGRRRVILIDAILGGTVGAIEIFENDLSKLDGRQWNAHHLSAPQSINLLQTCFPSFRDVRFTFVAVGVKSVEIRPWLSRELTARLPEILEAVLDNLQTPCLTTP